MRRKNGFVVAEIVTATGARDALLSLYKNGDIMTEQCLSTHCNELQRPAFFDYPRAFGSKLIHKVYMWRTHRRNRREKKQTVKALRTLDEAALKDIGLSAADVTWARSLPDSISATVELEIISRRRPCSESVTAKCD